MRLKIALCILAIILVVSFLGEATEKAYAFYSGATNRVIAAKTELDALKAIGQQNDEIINLLRRQLSKKCKCEQK